MAAHLPEFPIIKNEDTVAQRRGAQPVRNDQRRPILGQSEKLLVHLPFRNRILSGRGFIHDQNIRRIPVIGTRDRQDLPLAAGEIHSTKLCSQLLFHTVW